MSEKKIEQKSKGSNLIQLKISDKTKAELLKLADEVGMPINTYLYHLIIKEIKENKSLTKKIVSEKFAY